MNHPQEIIVYRNPWERDIYNAMYNIDPRYFLLILTLLVVIPLTFHASNWILDKAKIGWNNKARDILPWVNATIVVVASVWYFFFSY